MLCSTGGYYKAHQLAWGRTKTPYSSVREMGTHTGPCTSNTPPLQVPGLKRLASQPSQADFSANGAEEPKLPVYTLNIFVVTTSPVGRSGLLCAVASPRVALCEVAVLEVVLRHLIYVAPGALRHVLPRHLDVDLYNKIHVRVTDRSGRETRT